MRARDATLTLVAQCSNCAHWRNDPQPGHASLSQGFCLKGLAPEPGAILCPTYNVSHAFKNEIISTMLIEGGPMAMPVRLVGGRKSARKKKR